MESGGRFSGRKERGIFRLDERHRNDALEKLKGMYDEATAEMGIDTGSANDLWLQSMNYADANGIANVTLPS